MLTLGVRLEKSPLMLGVRLEKSPPNVKGRNLCVYTCLTKFTFRWKCPENVENVENVENLARARARARARLNTQMNTIENANHIYIRHATSKV